MMNPIINYSAFWQVQVKQCETESLECIHLSFIHLRGSSGTPSIRKWRVVDEHARISLMFSLMDQRTQTAPRTGLPWACLRSDLQQTPVSGPITTHFGIGKYENADLGIRGSIGTPSLLVMPI